MVGKSQTTLAGDERLRVVNVRLSLPPSSGQFSIITPNVCQSNKSVGILYSFDKFARIQWPQAFQPDEPFYEAFHEAR